MKKQKPKRCPFRPKLNWKADLDGIIDEWIAQGRIKQTFDKDGNEMIELTELGKPLANEKKK